MLRSRSRFCLGKTNRVASGFLRARLELIVNFFEQIKHQKISQEDKKRGDDEANTLHKTKKLGGFEVAMDGRFFRTKVDDYATVRSWRGWKK